MDVPSFTEVPPNGFCQNAWSSGAAARMPASQASTRSSDGRGGAGEVSAASSSGYFSSGPASKAGSRSAEAHHRSVRPPPAPPALEWESPAGPSRETGCQTPPPRPSRQVPEGEWETPPRPVRQQAPPQRRPPAASASAPALHQQQPAQAMRMHSEDCQSGTFCGLLTAPTPPKPSQRRQDLATPSPNTRPMNRGSFRAPGTAGARQCVQCGAQAVEASSFDHTCPRCNVVVCYQCVDDFRLIISSYRCPHCGDEKENQALLTNSAWQRNMLRSAKTVYKSIGDSWNALFTFEEPSGNSASGQAGGAIICGQQIGGVACFNAFDSNASMAPPTGQPQRQAPMGRNPQGVHVAREPHATLEPDHRTRLPAGWEEGAGLHGAAILQQMRAQDQFRTLSPR